VMAEKKFKLLQNFVASIVNNKREKCLTVKNQNTLSSMDNRAFRFKGIILLRKLDLL